MGLQRWWAMQGDLWLLFALGIRGTDEVSMLLTRGSYSPTSSRNRRFLLLYSVVMAYATGGM